MKKIYYTFPAIVTQTGGNYGVYFIDLPGCVATGTTLDEAVYLAKEGLAFHISGMMQDGEEIPSPTSLDDIDLKSGEILCLLETGVIKKSKNIPHVGKNLAGYGV